MTIETVKEPAVNMKGRQIVQIGIVVADAPCTAKRYSDLVGISPAVVFLASGEAKEIAGQALNVCGGMYFC